MMECLRFKSRDNARTPMQWDSSVNAGFTEGTPWIEVNPNYTGINARAALADKDSIFYYYKKLIGLRKEYQIITEGSYELLLPDSEELYAYTRTYGDEKLLTVCNFTGDIQKFEVPGGFEKSRCLIGNYSRDVYKGQIELKPYEAFVLYKCR